MSRSHHALSVALACLLVAAGCGGDDDSSTTAPTSSVAPTTTITISGHFDGLVAVGDHQLHLVCDGQGEPAVIIEMGAGQRVAAWNGLQPALAAERRACVYERAGTGTSEPGPEPRTAQRIADELDELLDAVDMSDPVIVLSHSIGGVDAQAFAQRHPDHVASLVFLDPRTAEFELGYRDLLTDDERSADERDMQQAITSEPFGAELAAFEDSARAATDAGKLPDVPVIVLTAELFDPTMSAEVHALWRTSHEHLAAQVSNGEARVVNGSEHEIWRTHQRAVLDAVDEVAAG